MKPPIDRHALALVAVATLAAIVALALDAGPARAFPGDVCRSARDCTGGGPQYCLAEDVYSSVGRCVSGKVLP